MLWNGLTKTVRRLGIVQYLKMNNQGDTTMPIQEKYQGKDNDGKPKSEYLEKVFLMTDEELGKECESKIWLSAYASNNSKSDFHWHVDACYDECLVRGKVYIYERAYKRISYNM
jgi:hypothetical protein